LLTNQAEDGFSSANTGATVWVETARDELCDARWGATACWSAVSRESRAQRLKSFNRRYDASTEGSGLTSLAD
jgi:hypothetical protein